MKVYKEFGLVQRDLIQFFRTADKMVRVPLWKNLAILPVWGRGRGGKGDREV